MTTPPLFITGNAHKAEQFERLLGFDIAHQKLDLDEIQSADPEEVIEHKVRQAYDMVKRPVFVDDFSFWFDELDGLPGPFIKYFVQRDTSLEKLCRLADGLATRRVTARAYFGYYDGAEVTILYGELKGTITMHPQGTADYAIATDFVFAVDGYGGRTRAELSREEYDEVYRIVRAVDEVSSFLRKPNNKYIEGAT
jgi:non-canonical purine NTP pyrophosphatase (RdgB/HAM1 family)